MIKKEIYFYVNSQQKINYEYIKKIGAHVIIKTDSKPYLGNFIIIKENCKSRNIPLFVSNNVQLMFKLGLRNLYLSAFNKRKYKNLPNNIKIIGSAHNKKEILEKVNQGCQRVILSRLFKSKKKGFLGIVKFNLIIGNFSNLIALGGINLNNYNKLKMLNIKGFASESGLKREFFR